MSSTPEYGVWTGMRKRCRPVEEGGSEDYGGRGITVDPRWATSFEQFYSDVGPRPGKGYVLDRRDNDGPYSPENCRWITWAESNRNTRGWGKSTTSRVSRLATERDAFAAERDAFREVVELLVSGDTREAKKRGRALLDS